MSFDRFYCPNDWEREIVVTGPEAHHISRVLRKQPGEQIEIFNGRGSYAHAEILGTTKKSVTLSILKSLTEASPLGPRITLAVASPKGDRLRQIIEKATELGVERFIPISTERSVVQPRESKLEKLEQTVISACKQCRRNSLMELSQSMSLSQLIESQSQDRLMIFGAPVGQSLKNVLSDRIPIRSFCIVVGPEGGFTETETKQLIEASALSVRLGEHILRVETAAIALSAATIGLLSGD